jgi:drug/metabolite transporter (DMT)-like permease
MIVARRLSGVPALGVVAASLVLTAAIYAPVALVQLPHALPSVPVMAAVGILAVVCTALGFLLFFALIAEVGPLRAQAITYVNPAVALALGVVLLAEPFTVGAAAGFALILLGVLLATRRPGGARDETGPAPGGSGEWPVVGRTRSR